MKRLYALVLALTLLLAFTPLTGCSQEEAGETVRIYNWGDYIAPGVIELFEEETGIEVVYDTFETNEDMYLKLKNSSGYTYDVVIPSDYMISKMLREDMLAEIDFNNVPNAAGIDERFKNLDYDPTGAYSVERIIEGMKAFQGRCIIQTMFLKGGYQGSDMDNTSDRFVLPWLERVKEIAPRQVMIYTIDRETPDHDLRKATHEELDRIGALVREAGFEVSVSY